MAELMGLVGPVARACGIERDARKDMPEGIFRFTQIPVSTWNTGDVLGRAHVRWLEIQRSLAFIREQLQHLPEGPLQSALPPLPPDRLAVSLVEGWRGEIFHWIRAAENNRLARCKVKDPSLQNWPAMSEAILGNIIPDFPVINKSFNLSYSGTDR